MNNYTESFKRGFIQGFPIAIGVAAYGVVYGMLTRNILTDAETVMSCLVVFAGVSQIMALDMWHAPLPMTAIIISTFIVNIRHVLMGASIYPYTENEKKRLAYPSLFFMVDEGWALTMGRMGKAKESIGYLAGTGVVLYILWLSAAMLGRNAGAFIPSPEKIGIDFALTAVFITIAVSGYRGRNDIPVIIAAAVTACLFEHFIGGKWYIIAGGMAGGFTAWVTYGNE